VPSVHGQGVRRWRKKAVSNLPGEVAHQLRPIATPFPLGCFALATASLLVAGSELGWFATSDRPIVAVVLVGFCFPLQMLASVYSWAATPPPPPASACRAERGW